MVTIKKIAERSGVSIGTVDRVIHNRGNVSKDTETRVKNALHELNYTPNIFARQLKLRKTFTFGVLIPSPDQDSRYWEMPAAGIRKAEEELKGHRIQICLFHYNRYSPVSFTKACENMLTYEIDGLLMVPALTSIAEKYIKRLPKDLPYVFFDSIVPQSSCLSYIVQDSYISGKLAGRLMHLLLSNQGSVAAIRVVPEDFHIAERIRGFQDYFTQVHGIDLKTVDAHSKGDQNTIMDLVHQILKENKDLKGIFISNALTYCIAQVLEGKKLQKKIHVIGYDLIKENIEYMKKGEIDFLISQQSERQGYQGIYTLYRHVVLKESVPRKIMIPIDIITKENVDYYPL
ncbi:substrate-binding domain-containing protein [bacterium]|nr:substrate-binding domain-containing protein [bacterium]